MNSISLLELILEEYEPEQKGSFKDIGQYISIPYASYMLPSKKVNSKEGGVSGGLSEFIDIPIVPVETLTGHLIKYMQSAIKNISSQTTPGQAHYIEPNLLFNLKSITQELKDFQVKLKTEFSRQFKFPIQSEKRIFLPSSVYYNKTDIGLETIYRPMVPIVSIIDYLVGSIKTVLKNSKTYTRLREKDIDYVSPSQLSTFRKIIKELLNLSEELRYNFPEQFKLSTHQSAKQFLKK